MWKTVLVSKLLENTPTFSELPPARTLHIYKVWHPKYNDIKWLGDNFIEDNDNIVDDIKSGVSGQPMLIIFDDLFDSSLLKNIASLFTVDARLMNMSWVFLTQGMFFDN